MADQTTTWSSQLQSWWTQNAILSVIKIYFAMRASYCLSPFICFNGWSSLIFRDYFFFIVFKVVIRSGIEVFDV